MTEEEGRGEGTYVKCTEPICAEKDVNERLGAAIGLWES